MSATNDGLVDRYALPGVPNPILEADIVNKQTLEEMYPGAVMDIPLAVYNTTVLQNSYLHVTLKPRTSYALELFAVLSPGTNVTGIKCAFKITPTSPIIDPQIFWQFSNKDSQPNIPNGSEDYATSPLVSGNFSRIFITGEVSNRDVENIDRTLIFQFAQDIATPSNLVLGVGSYLRLTRLPLLLE